jgi:hypothetical protein
VLGEGNMASTRSREGTRAKLQGYGPAENMIIVKLLLTPLHRGCKPPPNLLGSIDPFDFLPLYALSFDHGFHVLVVCRYLGKPYYDPTRDWWINLLVSCSRMVVDGIFIKLPCTFNISGHVHVLY